MRHGDIFQAKDQEEIATPSSRESKKLWGYAIDQSGLFKKKDLETKRCSILAIRSLAKTAKTDLLLKDKL